MYAKLLIESQKYKSKNRELLLTVNKPKISVIQTIRSELPSETHLDSIISLINQTYSNWELIIVNDGGVLSNLFGNEKILKNKNKIKIINSGKIGRANALNLGIKIACGEYISYLDADNYYDEHFLEVMSDNIIDDDLDLIYCGQLRFSDDSVTPLFFNNLDRNDFLISNKIDLNTILHKVNLTVDNKSNVYGFFDTRLTRLIDWALFLKLMDQDIKINSIPYFGSYYFDGFRDKRISSNNEHDDNLSFIRNLILNNPKDKQNKTNVFQICQFCQHNGFDFKPSGTKSTVFEKYSVLGGGYRLNNLCPQCGSIDRHRSINFILRDITKSYEAKRILHIAPESTITNLIAEILPNANVTLGDKYPSNSNILKIDLTRIPFQEATFDLIICSHVLEHVKQDKIAINEIFRVLKPDGYAICPTPYSDIIFSSIEEPVSNNYTQNQRQSIFGQTDHVKIYEKNDYIARFTESGFKHIKFDMKIMNAFNANACEMFVYQKLSKFSDVVESIDNEENIIPTGFANELGGWAIEEDLVDLVDSLLGQFEKPSLIEFGSGRGSKSLAHLIKKHNGKMSSIEGDENWANFVDNELKLNNLSDYVQILHAPLASRIEMGIPTKFYSETFLDYLNFKIDLVIVDGPQGDISPVARYPALKSIYNKLNNEKFYVILDDYNRVDEKLIIEMWRLEFPQLYFLPIKLEVKQICVISNINLDGLIKYTIG